MSILLTNQASIPLKDVPNETKLQIIQMFSYPLRDGEYISNFNYTKDTLYVPPAIPKLKKIAELLNTDIVDKRSKGKPLSEPFALNESFKFRGGQLEPCLEFLAHVKEHQYGTLLAPCGSGKSAMLSWVGGHLQCKILILLDQKNLIDNWEKSFEMIWGKKLQIISGKDTSFADISCATYQLLHRDSKLLARIKEEFGILIIEECHSVPAKSFIGVVNGLSNFYRLACTATFYRKTFPVEILEDICSPISVEVTQAERLVPKVIFVKTNYKLVSNNPDEFSKIVSEMAGNELRNEVILSLVKKSFDNKRVMLVICSRTEQADWLAERAAKFCNAISYHSKTHKSVEDNLKENVESGKIDVIFSCNKARKGLDLQNLDLCILAHLSNNEGDLQQISGRILRLWTGKPKPVIIDLVDEGDMSFRFIKAHRRWYKKWGYELVSK